MDHAARPARSHAAAPADSTAARPSITGGLGHRTAVALAFARECRRALHPSRRGGGRRPRRPELVEDAGRRRSPACRHRAEDSCRSR
ncbi:hypothetical protein LT493_44430 [Streptomyces tricolor]|nr:hypothetical protein [Streptomyces tricolor]